MLTASSTTNSFNDDNYPLPQTTIPLIHSIPEVPSTDQHDRDLDEYDDDDELIRHHLGNQSDIDDEGRFPIEDDDDVVDDDDEDEDDEYSTRINEPLLDIESIKQ
jgi:hypothetical protein